MSRTYSRLVSEGEQKLKLLLEPDPGKGADLRLRLGGFFAGFEKLEDLYAEIEIELSKRSTNSSAGDANGRCTVSEEPAGSHARRDSVKTEESGQPGEDTPIAPVAKCDNQPSCALEVGTERPSLDANSKLPSGQINGSEGFNGEPGLNAEEDFEGNVDDFNVRNSMLEPVSILDLQYEGSKGVQSSSYLYGSLKNQRLKMQKISHFKFWFDDKWKREPEIWISIEQHRMVRLGIPTVQYKSFFDAVLLVARYLYQAMRHPQDASIFDNLRGTYEHYRDQDIEAEVTKHKTFVAMFAELNPDVKRCKALMDLLNSSSREEASAKESRSLPSSSGKKRKKLVIDESDESEPESRNEDERQKNDSADGKAHDEEVKTPDADSLGDPICALCDDGGDVTFCDGPCLRSFHATKFRGKDSRCPSLKYSRVDIERLESKQQKFLCGNCQRGKHQCFLCKGLGSSNGPAEGFQEVFQCQDNACGKFYHLSCLSVAERVFTCPAHLCALCKTGREESLVKCRLCPKAWHKDCVPRDISFEEDPLFINPQRGWILGDSVVLYCSEHDYDFDLGMPARARVDFADGRGYQPAPQQPAVESSRLVQREEPVSRQSVQDKPRWTQRGKQVLQGKSRSARELKPSKPSSSECGNMVPDSVVKQKESEREALGAKVPKVPEGSQGTLTLLSPSNLKRRPAVLLSELAGRQQKHVGKTGKKPTLQERLGSTSSPRQPAEGAKTAVQRDPSLVVSNVLKRKVPSKQEVAKKRVEYLQFSPPRKKLLKGLHKVRPGGPISRP